MHLSKKMSVPASLTMMGLALFVAGCSTEASGRSATKTDSVSGRGNDAPKELPVKPGEVLEPREGETFDAAEYVATEGPYRLFGVEPGDGTRVPTAILADARTWATRGYGEGELVGRGMKVAKIDVAAGRVTLHGTTGDVVLESGKNVELRVVRHKLDVVARPLGRHRYALDTAAARAATPTLPTFETAELYGASVVKLGPVPPGSLLAGAGLVEGDLVTAPEGTGEAAGQGTLEELQRALTDGRSEVVIHVVRAGVPIDRTYLTQK